MSELYRLTANISLIAASREDAVAQFALAVSHIDDSEAGDDYLGEMSVEQGIVAKARKPRTPKE